MVWLAFGVWTWIGADNCQHGAMRKTKSVHGSGCDWGDDFSEKKKSRNISLPSFFSHRLYSSQWPQSLWWLQSTVGSWHPLSSYSEGILPLNIGFTIFLTAQTIFIRRIPHCIPCTLALSDYFLSLPSRHITPWHFWHFGIMKCARVQGVHGG